MAHNTILKIALIQSHLLWENPEANRQLFSKKIKTISTSTDLIVLPEMFTTGFTMKPENINVVESEKTLNWLKSEAAKNNTAIIGSTVYQKEDKFYNRLFFVDYKGNVKPVSYTHLTLPTIYSV